MTNQINTPKFKSMDLVWGGRRDLCIVLLGPLDIPYFQDGCGSNFAFTPLDITNPDEWKSTDRGYITYSFDSRSYAIYSEFNMKLVEQEGIKEEGHIPFDKGTANLRECLGLIKLAHKWYGDENVENKVIDFNK